MSDEIRKYLEKKSVETEEALDALVLPHLKREEGFRSNIYLDSEGYWTIGYGRLLETALGGGISREEGEFLLKNDLESVKRGLDTQLPWWRSLSKVRRAILISMVFQMGISRFMGFQRMIQAMWMYKYGEAAN